MQSAANAVTSIAAATARDNAPCGEALPSVARAFRTRAPGCSDSRQSRIPGKRSFVCDHGLDRALHVVEQHAQVVEQHRIAAARLDCFAVRALRAGEAPVLVQEAPQIDVRIQKRRIGGDGALVRVDRGIGLRSLERQSAFERFGCIARRGRARALDHAQCACGGIALEVEHVLAGIRPPAACPLPDDHAAAHRADRQPGKRHGLGEAAAKLAHRFGDPPPGNVRSDQCLRGAQHDQVLEREPPCPARTPCGRDESGSDQRPDRAARQA
jgi:hypothetical protein